MRADAGNALRNKEFLQRRAGFKGRLADTLQLRAFGKRYGFEVGSHEETPAADGGYRAGHVDMLDVCHVLLERFVVLCAHKVLVVKGIALNFGDGLAACFGKNVHGFGHIGARVIDVENRCVVAIHVVNNAIDGLFGEGIVGRCRQCAREKQGHGKAGKP